jgi:hypothetical protein
MMRRVAVAVERFWAVVARYDARLARPGAAVRVDYEALPAPGDVVLVYDGARVRALVFDEVSRPMQPVWIIGVVRMAVDRS